MAVIQARLSSTRLPGKVLREIGGKPILQWQIERLSRVNGVGQTIVATSTERSDDPLAAWCAANSIPVHRGSEKDVLGRVASCLTAAKAHLHVEITGDAPFIDPDLISHFLQIYHENSSRINWLTSTHKTTFPPGTEVSIHSVSSLVELDKLVEPNDPLREHVTIHYLKAADKICGLTVEAEADLHCPDLNIEIDYPEDLIVAENILSHFRLLNVEYPSTIEIICLYKKHPDLFQLNQKLVRRWSRFRSD